MRTAIFLLMSSAIGSGYLMLPSLCKSSGIILSVFIVIFSGILTCFSSYQIIRGNTFLINLTCSLQF